MKLDELISQRYRTLESIVDIKGGKSVDFTLPTVLSITKNFDESEEIVIRDKYFSTLQPIVSETTTLVISSNTQPSKASTSGTASKAFNTNIQSTFPVSSSSLGGKNCKSTFLGTAMVHICHLGTTVAARALIQ
ncbi:unnamed protein product [Ceratitis capitata]|uniref:(Mediterranean fruit fly) hypothetical protein n=1 Tax=Ceratitis capitata TaxID=7213 RepID=A0A811UWY2_CERCA|nr:unnamed protein product [Ceratitis capitata]